MTNTELQAEWTYAYEERLAILGVPAGAEPTPDQKQIAQDCADDCLQRLMENGS
jgi:hypothetical protein